MKLVSFKPILSLVKMSVQISRTLLDKHKSSYQIKHICLVFVAYILANLLNKYRHRFIHKIFLYSSRLQHAWGLHSKLRENVDTRNVLLDIMESLDCKREFTWNYLRELTGLSFPFHVIRFKSFANNTFYWLWKLVDKNYNDFQQKVCECSNFFSTYGEAFLLYGLYAHTVESRAFVTKTFLPADLKIFSYW